MITVTFGVWSPKVHTIMDVKPLRPVSDCYAMLQVRCSYGAAAVLAR